MKRTFITISLLLLFLVPALPAQIPVRQWRDHLTYSSGIKVAIAGNKVYCATQDGLFSYNKNDNSLEKLSKVNGLSDVGISALNYSSDLNLLIIGYSNGNLDLISGSEIINIQDIKRKLIVGNKSVNNILPVGNLAYLSCGFGIVVVNLGKKEIYDTYYIGDNGTKININELSYDGLKLYAATAQGIYVADFYSSGLADFSNWSRITEIPHYTEEFTSIACFNGYIYFNYRPQNYNDTIFRYREGIWEYADTSACYSIIPYEDKLSICHWGHCSIISTNGQKTIIWHDKFRPRHVAWDIDNTLWVADEGEGLKRISNWGAVDFFYPNGPYNNEVVDMNAGGGTLITARGGRKTTWNGIGRQGVLNTFVNETWSSYLATTADTITDIVSVLVDPGDPAHYYAGSWNGGLLEFHNHTLSSIYRNYNSNYTLEPVITGMYYKVGGMAFDADHNLWITVSDVENPIVVKMNDGSWQKLNYGSYFNAFLIDEIVITQNDHKWLTLPRGGGITVFDEKNTFNTIDDDDIISFSILDEHGELITNEIYAIAEDKDGYIWIGTNSGVVVYYHPENVFGGDNFYASRIIVEIDSTAQYLLETEAVADIEIDGANRKWFATINAGAFLMSEDGTEQVLHFNTDNSPLPSNTIFCMAIDGNSGEVFFGTDKGIVSYKGTATEGKDDFADVYVYPNPVRPDYDGPVTITNLVANANVKITDVAGNIVWETTAEGGQAVWEGENFDGKRVKTGVYLVFCTNDDGSKTHVTKLLFIN
ncbi:MAG: T9SS type A sorting domain-containing protein [Bacteroidetes bacterium]|nr:T9SS type A sorting domain-containing protein [Bacteroidota bacterium]